MLVPAATTAAMTAIAVMLRLTDQSFPADEGTQELPE
jgi:hypothetical protein